MRRAIFTGLLIALASQQAYAGAWTLDHGRLSIMSGVVASRATQRFDRKGALSGQVIFNKLLVQNWMEYGVTDAVTVFAMPEYVVAKVDGSRYQSTSIEGGLRILLLSHVGMLSLQSSVKTAGAFDMSTSAGGEAGRQIELRLLYGTNFKLFGREAFFDVEAARRWIKRPRPDEFEIDSTFGVWVSRNNLLMLQNFNMIAAGGARTPYTYYRLHKLQVSWVRRIARHWYLESGYLYAPMGRNIVQEQGFITKLWFRC